MELRKTNKYTEQFRQDVVNMIQNDNKPIPELCKELGLPEQTVYRWYRKMGIPRDEKEDFEQLKKENKALKAKLMNVTEERDILKKAVTIFSKQGISR